MFTRKIFRARTSHFIRVLGAVALAVGGAVVTSSASANAATMGWAKVSSSGVLLAESGVSKVIKVGRGRYEAITTVDISKCALTGTVNTIGGTDPGPGSGSILVGDVNSTTLFIRTATPSATFPKTVDDDRAFSVAFFCH